MPTIRKLAPEEIAQQEKSKLGPRQEIAQKYNAMLAGFTPGDWGELELTTDDNRQTLRARLQAAARRQGIQLHFHRAHGNLMRFVVEEPHVEASREEARRPPRVAV